jgi:hypothetical protein
MRSGSSRGDGQEVRPGYTADVDAGIGAVVFEKVERGVGDGVRRS